MNVELDDREGKLSRGKWMEGEIWADQLKKIHGLPGCGCNVSQDASQVTLLCLVSSFWNSETASRQC